MDVATKYIPSEYDYHLVHRIVNELKLEGIFDQFRKECTAEVVKQKSYQNLTQEVEESVTNFLQQQVWKSDMNKNELREMLRKNIEESGSVQTDVDRIVDEVVNSKIESVLLPQIQDFVYRFLSKQKSEIPPQNLLSTDLEPISPETMMFLQYALLNGFILPILI